jgi:predicted peptidase
MRALLLLSLLPMLLAACSPLSKRHAPVTAHQLSTTRIDVQGRSIPVVIATPNAPPPRSGWPVVLFLHGSGELGDDGQKHLAVGLIPAVTLHPARWPAIIVAPQLPEGRWATHHDIALAALELALRTSPCDPTRVALTGLSNGGQGAWSLAAEYPTRFTSVVVVCGPSLIPADADSALTKPLPTLTGAQAARTIESLSKQRIWAFHGDKDDVVPVEHTQAMQRAIRAANPHSPLRVNYLQNVDHAAWTPAYADEDVALWLTR